MNKKVEIKPDYFNLMSVFDKRFFIPIYQRPYSWEKNQIDELMKDLFDNYDNSHSYGLSEDQLNSTSEKQNPFFLGNIIVDESNKEKFLVIDGQQRITTLSLLLLVLYIKLQKDQSNISLLNNIKSLLWYKTNGIPQKEKRTIELSDFENEYFVNLFDIAFDEPSRFIGFIKENNINCNNSKSKIFYERLQKNCALIFQHIEQKEKDESFNFANFVSFVLSNVYVIYIAVTDNDKGSASNLGFTLFESINSKGKELEEIDKIKNYIFSKFSGNKQEECLKYWGNIINSTNDNAMKYLNIYLKSVINFKPNKYNYSKFKELGKELEDFFHVSTLSECYACLLKDLNDNLDLFLALSKFSTCEEIFRNNGIRFESKWKFKAFYMIMKALDYEYTSYILFFSLYKIKIGQIKDVDFEKLIVNTIKYNIVYLTIMGKGSKYANTTMHKVFNILLSKNPIINVDEVIKIYSSDLVSNKYTLESIGEQLKKYNAYGKNKPLAKAILCLDDSKSDRVNIDWEKFCSLYNEQIQLDHKLPQYPNSDDAFLKYYCYGEQDNEQLMIKEGGDFPGYKTGDSYKTFLENFLNTIGNLARETGTENLAKKNIGDKDFCTYSQVIERAERLANQFTGILLLDVVHKGETTEFVNQILEEHSLTDNFSWEKKKPTEILFLGNKRKIKNQCDILINICLIAIEVNKKYQDILKELAVNEKRDVRDNVVLISKTKRETRNAKQILRDEVYISTGFNATTAKQECKFLLELLGIDTKELKIYFKI